MGSSGRKIHPTHQRPRCTNASPAASCLGQHHAMPSTVSLAPPRTTIRTQGFSHTRRVSFARTELPSKSKAEAGRRSHHRHRDPTSSTDPFTSAIAPMMFFQKPSASPTYRAAVWGVAILGVVAWTYWYAKQGWEEGRASGLRALCARLCVSIR